MMLTQCSGRSYPRPSRLKYPHAWLMDVLCKFLSHFLESSRIILAVNLRLKFFCSHLVRLWNSIVGVLLLNLIHFRLSPGGVMFLVMSKVIEMKDFSVVAGQVGMYTLTVLIGLLLHGFVVLPLIYVLIMRKEPFTFLLDMLQAITTAFGTASRWVSFQFQDPSFQIGMTHRKSNQVDTLQIFSAWKMFLWFLVAQYLIFSGKVFFFRFRLSKWRHFVNMFVIFISFLFVFPSLIIARFLVLAKLIWSNRRRIGKHAFCLKCCFEIARGLRRNTSMRRIDDVAELI